MVKLKPRFRHFRICVVCESLNFEVNYYLKFSDIFNLRNSKNLPSLSLLNNYLK